MFKESSEKPSSEKIESEKKYEGKFLNFFELRGEQIKELQKSIEEHNGLVRIFVHPDYTNYADYEKDRRGHQMAKKLQQMNEALKRILSSDDEKTPPIIILESQLGLSDKLKRLKIFSGTGVTYRDQVEIWQELRAQGKESHSDELRQFQLTNDTYIIPTAFAAPMPFIEDAATEKDAWEKLNKKLLELGVKKILIGGNELYTSDLKNEDWLGGCLGHTIEELKNNFEIELSTLIYPEGRKELREKNIKIKKQS